MATPNKNMMPPPPEGSGPDWKYEGLRYNPSDLPAELPLTNDLLPCERKEVRTLQAQELHQQKTIEAYDKAQHKKEQGGFTNNLSAFFGPHVAKLKNRPGKIKEDIPSEREEKRFNDRFHFQSKEKLLYASQNCKLISEKNLQVIGKLNIGERYLAFRESHLQPRTGGRNPVLFTIPLSDIALVTKAITLKQYQPGEVPEFRTLDTHLEGADAIFVYTKQGFLHRFATFWSQHSYNDTFTVLDRQWRTVCGKPIGSNPKTSQTQTETMPLNQSNVGERVQTTAITPNLVVEQTSVTVETPKN